MELQEQPKTSQKSNLAVNVEENKDFVATDKSSSPFKDMIMIRGQNYYPQEVENTVKKSHVALSFKTGAAFTIEFKGKEELVIVQELEWTYRQNSSVKEVISFIRKEVQEKHGLGVHTLVFVKPGSIPKTAKGKIKRNKCRAKFLNRSLHVIDDWSENPSNTQKYLQLSQEIELLWEFVQRKSNKNISIS
jgi:acyl-CoA synthetase (AMP-forming)/AMP-acid ligase II